MPDEFPPTQAHPPPDETVAYVRGPSLPGAGPVAVPGYELLGELGRGGMGVVYQARQVAANRVVALKMILGGEFAGADARDRFRAEVEATARLKHPGIVPVYEVGEHAGLPYYSMEFCPGGSLARHAGGQPLAPEAAAALVERVARSVEAAHLAGIVHRDLKPANVLLGDDGAPKITDFGLAKRLDSPGGPTQTGAVMGTPAYMAPEQAAGRSKSVGPGADIYALGAILYELLAGQPPFQGETLTDVLQKVLHDEPDRPSSFRPGVPKDLETVCLKCLHKDPAGRYPTAGALAEDLRRFQAGESVSARPQNLVERVAGVLYRSQHEGRVARYAGMFFIMAAVMLATETIATLLWCGLVSEETAFLTFMARPVTMFALLLYFGRGAMWPANLVEQHLVGVWGGFILAVILLTLYGDGHVPAMSVQTYQAFAAAAGMGYFAMGALFWGGCFLVGLVFLALVPLMTIEPRLAPLMYGLTWAGCLAIGGSRLRRRAKAAG